MVRLTLSLLLALAAAISNLPAQDLHVHYDAHLDSISFLQNGKPSRPMVRKGSMVILHVSNYNNYLYDLQLKTTTEAGAPAQRSGLGMSNLRTAGGFNPLQLLLGTGNPLSGVSSLLRGFSGSLSNDDESGFISSEQNKESVGKEQQESLAELKWHISQFEAVWQNAEKKAQDISKVQKEIESHLQILQVQAFAAKELERIRRIPQIEPRQLKELSQRYMKYIFGHENPGELGIDEIVESAGIASKLPALQQRYGSLVDQYAEEAAAVSLSASVFSDPRYDFSGSNIFQLRSAASKAVKTATENTEAYNDNLQTMKAGLPAVQGLSAQELANIQTEYIVLMQNDFSKTFRHSAEEEDFQFQMVFSPLDSAAAAVVTEKTIEPVKIMVYGGLQVKPAVGLGFGGFFRQPQNYFVRDSLIFSSNRDAVTPYLTSFIHFYSKSRRETSLGGSLGVGVPLSGNENAGLLDAVSFFVGPSVVLGRNQSLVLNFSLMGGKVNRLAEGFTTGDYFDGPTELLKTESVYRLGYALGVSFNLGSF